MSPKAIKFSIITLFVLVLISLGLNIYLILQLMRSRQQAILLVNTYKPAVQNALKQMDGELASFQESTVEFDVKIEQNFPVNIDIPINESIEIPISMTVPIKDEFESTIMMDPFQTGLAIPVDVVVPVDVEVPIDVVIPVEVDRTVPISTSIPLNLNFPVAIEVSDTDIAPYIEQLRKGLAASEQFIEQATAHLDRE